MVYNERTRAATYRWRAKHPERARAAAKRWRDANREKLNARKRERYWENREKFIARVTDYERRVRYSLTREQIDAMAAAQGNSCAICRSEFTYTPHVDHDHQTGKVRALLCRTCNIGVGYLEHRMAPQWGAYIARHKEGTELDG